jgi:stearoyl-CoA desaturase (Delta-9 desaturase)
LRRSDKLNWTVLLFVTLSPVVAIVGTIWWSVTRFEPQTLVLAAVLAAATGLSVTAGYHRMYSHCSYRAAWPIRVLMLLFASAAFEESAVSWSRDHRKHHRFLDREGDPYSITGGFWHAHFLWMFWTSPDGNRWPADLWNDRLVRLQHRLYFPLAALVGIILPTALAATWGDPWGGLFVAGFARIVVNHHFTFAINSVCHAVGNRPYSETLSARDNWVTALFTYGEGYHNFHHEFPSDYRNGYARYHFDPTKWLIFSLSRLGLARDLRSSDRELVVSKRVGVEERRVRERLQSAPAGDVSAVRQRISTAKERVESALERVRAQRSAFSAPMRDGKRRRMRVAALQRRLRLAHQEFDRAVANWDATVRSI